MKKLFSPLSLLVVFSLLLTACGAGASPTATPVPPTATPSATPIPPTMIPSVEWIPGMDLPAQAVAKCAEPTVEYENYDWHVLYNCTTVRAYLAAQSAALTPQPAPQLVARDLGPWAPNGTKGENFEVTCNETNCVGVHLQVWWPAGSGQPWGTKEISVFIPAGLSIEVQLGAGKGFEYPLGYLLSNIQAEIAADNSRRATDTSFYGVVDIDDLIATGLVVVRFDRR